MQLTVNSKKILAMSVISSYILGYVYIEGYIDTTYGEQFIRVLFLAGFIAWVELMGFFYRKNLLLLGEDISRDGMYRFESILFLICLTVISLTNTFEFGMFNSGFAGDTELTSLFSYIFMHAVAIYYTLVRLGALIGRHTGRFFLLDYLNGLIIFPFGNWFLRTKTVFTKLLSPAIKNTNSVAGRRNIIITLLVMVATFAMLGVVISILSTTDEIFKNIFSIEFDIDEDILIKAVLSLPVGCYLFGLIFGSIQKAKKQQTVAGIQAGVERLRTVGSTTLTVAISLFTMVYIVYISLQLSYFLSAFSGRLPEHITYSQYARQGFFELCVIMAINLCILFAVSRFAGTPVREHLPLKTSAIVFLVMSKLFAINALAKLIMYITVYGFTALRLISAWAIFVLILAIVLSFITILRPIKGVRILIFSSVASFALLSLA